MVVSAGAVDSPRLLLLSGVGAADELEQAGVAVVHDLPGVGRNLHDHPLCGIVYEASQPIPAGLTNHAEVSMLWRSDQALVGPDMQLMFIHLPFHPPTLQAPANSFTFGVATVPEARGSVRIAGPDPQTPPLIDPNYLGAESDVRRLLHGIEVAREIAASEPFAPWRAREVLPGPDVTDEAGLREFVARGTGTYYHPVGTCAMGVGPEAVVAPDLRVHGLDGLRVADASVMPRLVCVNTNAATIMIGEKAADLIHAARRLKTGPAPDNPSSREAEENPAMTDLLDDVSWQGKIYSNGWTTAHGGVLDSTEPATGAVLAQVGLADADDVAAATARAAQAQADWAAQTGPSRAAVIRKAAAVLADNRAEFERWLVREGGAVPGKAAFEVDLVLGELWEAAALPTQPWGHLL